MICNRKWHTFLPRCEKNLGYLVFVAIGTAIFLYAINNSSNWFWLGIILILIGLILWISLSWPERKISADKKLGEKIEIEEVKYVYPTLVKVGIVGSTSVGKTTLSENITQIPYSRERTQKTSAYITSTRTSPAKYFALIDGPGNNTPQQFDIIKNSDIIILLFDHNESNSSRNILDSRLRDLSILNNQFRNLFNQHNLKMKQIHLLLNKKDLWENVVEVEKQKLNEWFENECNRWKHGNFAEQISFNHHSNLLVEDVNNLINELNI